jgi:hypothetical protein
MKYFNLVSENQIANSKVNSDKNDKACQHSKKH